MQLESRIIPSRGEEPMYTVQARNRREVVQQILSEQARATAKISPQETKFDIITTAVVIGMTAQFISFIFGMVTEYVPRLLDVALISVALGGCVMAIAYALMKESD